MKVDITSFGSSSKGNCHYVTDQRTGVFLDAGIPLKKIRQAGDNYITKASACLISHGHINDHAGHIKDFLRVAIDCYMLPDAAQRAAVGRGMFDHRRVKFITPGKIFRVGSWKIFPFDAVHDIPCVGFFMASDEGLKLLYATDTAFIRERFAGITHAMVEVNYDTKSLNEATPDTFKKKRIMATHFGLDNLLEFLKANDLRQLQELRLLHLSNTNANERRILEAVERVVPPGVNVIVCKE